MNFNILAYFQDESPTYSAKAVRFRMGHKRYPMNLGSAISDDVIANPMLVNNEFIWTYTSPEFPMVQVSCSIKKWVILHIFCKTYGTAQLNYVILILYLIVFSYPPKLLLSSLMVFWNNST